jgi:hypothetical protein
MTRQADTTDTNSATDSSDAVSYRGLALAVAVVGLMALVLWGPLDAAYQGGFAHWVLAVVVTAGALALFGLRAVLRGQLPLGLGLVGGSLIGLAVVAFGWFVWVLTQMGG